MKTIKLAICGLLALAGSVSAEVYELRTYLAAEGKLEALQARFRDHTVRIFEKHGMKNIGYWTPDGEEGKTTLIYLLAHKSREEAKRSWDAFRVDPEWAKARDASQVEGKLVKKVTSVYLSPTDFSALK